MESPKRPVRNLVLGVPLALGTAVAYGVTTQPITPEPPTDIGAVSVRGGGNPPASGMAGDVAPSRAPLEAAQPTSLVGPQYICNVIPTQNYEGYPGDQAGLNSTHTSRRSSRPSTSGGAAG